MLRLPRRQLLALGASLAAPFAATQPRELLMAVASSLADAVREIGAGFAATQPGLSLRITTEGTIADAPATATDAAPQA